MNKVMASLEVLQHGLAMAEKARAHGKATDLDVLIAAMQLCARMLHDKGCSEDEMTDEEVALADELLGEMKRKAALVDLDLEDHDNG
jgi:hypothetical protein